MNDVQTNDHPTNHTMIFSISKLIATIIFGLIIPAMLAYKSFQNLDSLSGQITFEPQAVSVFKEIKNSGKPLLQSNQDYYLFTLLSLEDSLQRSLSTKQQMKVSAMYIGYAIISIGLMFIVFGFREESSTGSSVKGSGGGITLDVTTGSAGLFVFVLGVSLSAAASLIPNTYYANKGPQYSTSNPAPKLKIVDASDVNKSNIIRYERECKEELAVFEQAKFDACVSRKMGEGQ